MNNDASWTCHRCFDGALVQLDFVVNASRMPLVRSWCDHCIFVGVDHRCVHCIVAFMSRKLRQRSNDETDAQLHAETGQQRPSFRISKVCSHIAHFGAKSWKYRFGEYTCGRSNCSWTLSSTNIVISSFATSSSTSVTTAPCTKATMSERTRRSNSVTPCKKARIGNLKGLAGTWWRFRHGNV